MSLFLTKEGKRKSPMAVTIFFVDLLFCLVFGGAYALLTEPLHSLLPLGGGMPETVLHCLIIAVIGTAVCCVLFLLPAITIMCLVASTQLEADLRGMMVYVTLLYTLLPILIGNLAAWTIYFKLRSKDGLRR